MIDWKEPIQVLNAIENNEDKKAGGRIKRLPWLIGMPIVFAIAHPVMATNFKPMTMVILFFVGLGIGAVIYVWGHSTTSMIQTIKINQKGILRIYIGANMANHFIPWEAISLAQIDYIKLQGHGHRLLLLYGLGDELITKIAIPESITTNKLLEEFDKNDCELKI